MKLSEFILERMEDILVEWEAYARSLPAGHDLSTDELRDHAGQMLIAIAREIDTPQTPEAQRDKSRGLVDIGEWAGSDAEHAEAAVLHGELRHASQFSPMELHSEFRALRASVLRLWFAHVDQKSPDTLEAVIRFNEAIDQALAESVSAYAARAESARDLLVAILGHELRGPLATMSTIGDWLDAVGASQPDALSAMAARVRRACRQMGVMVSGVLGYARTKLGNGLPVAFAHADLAQICAAAVDEACAIHPECQIRVDTAGHLDGDLDAARVQQMIVNLLVNACEHGARGSEVKLSVVGDADAFRLRVHNLGRAIPSEHLQHIFEPLVRVDDGYAAQPGNHVSLGLGLYVAREVAEAHGGEIHCVSNDREGTAFEVFLPRRHWKGEDLPGASPPELAPS